MKHARIPYALRLLAVAAVFAIPAVFGPGSGIRVAAQVPPPPPNPSQNTPNPAQTTIPVTGPTATTPLPSEIPSASPTPAPRRGRHRRGADASPSPGGSPTPAGSPSGEPAPTATPTSPAFATLDGTWEVQLQYFDRTDYSYVKLAQTTGGELTGDWRYGGKSYPLSGTYDGRLIKFTVTMPTGPTAFSGYVEGAQDMVGLVEFPKDPVPTPLPSGAKPEPSPKPTPSPPQSSVFSDGVPFTAEHRASGRSVFKASPTK